MKMLLQIILNERIIISFIVSLIIFTDAQLNAQAVNDYRSAQTGNWGTLTTWQRWNGTSWATPTSGEGTPNNNSGVTTIRNTHNVSVAANVTADQITIDAGGQLTVNSATVLTLNNGTGTDLTVNGTVIVNGTLVNSGTITKAGTASITFNANSTYQHARNGSAIPTCTWNINSTCYITGITTTLTGSSFGLGQTFGNFTWNCTSQTAAISFAGYLTTVNGNFTINSTGSGSLRLLNGNAVRTLNIGGNFSQTNGSLFVLGSGGTTTTSMTMAIKGNFSFSGGTLTVNGSTNTTDSGRVKVAGNFSHTAGTTITETSAGQSEIIFNGTTAQYYTSGGSVTNAINFTVNSGSTLQMSASGTLLSGGGNFTLSSGATLGITSNNGITLSGASGNIQVSGARTYNGSANYIYNGTTAQVTGNGLTSANNLTINNPGGVSLSGAVSVNGALSLTNGIIASTAANLLTASASCSISGGSSTSFVNGPFSRGKNTAAQQTLFYPIGKNSSYRPIELIVTHSNTNLSNYTAEVFNTAPAARTLPGTLSRISNVRYWNVSKSGTATVTSAFITINYGADDGVSDPQDLKIAKDNGSVWVDIGGTANGSPVGSILSSQFTTFSDFVLANANGGSNPLPVELYSFTGLSRKNDVVLNWSTKTEVQNYGFDIERCVKPEKLSAVYNWAAVGFVRGSGNSNSQKEYSFIDKQLNPGTYLFRLKQLDTDGNFQYSAEIEIAVGLLPDMFIFEQNYPNPFNPVTTIRFAVNESGPVSVKVYDALGNEVRTLFNEPAESGRFYTLEFNGSDYASGVYYYSINGNNLHAVKKMLLIK
ncbi:MAG TPA: T9SS type A sorting domain-containing protein [Ignavibacteriaceae bacterium]|nr:T9SS type A sorting domain-containing protein [Ignavibacteriaceae bacterium]